LSVSRATKLDALTLDIYNYKLIVSTTKFDVAYYGDVFMEHYKQRLLGVSGASGSSITVLRSTVLNPWQTETSKGSFLDVIENEFRQAVSDFLLLCEETQGVGKEGVSFIHS
jgi:hypothetical protein